MVRHSSGTSQEVFEICCNHIYSHQTAEKQGHFREVTAFERADKGNQASLILSSPAGLCGYGGKETQRQRVGFLTLSLLWLLTSLLKAVQQFLHYTLWPEEWVGLLMTYSAVYDPTVYECMTTYRTTPIFNDSQTFYCKYTVLTICK